MELPSKINSDENRSRLVNLENQKQELCEDLITVHSPAALPLPFATSEGKDEVIAINPAFGEGKRIVTDAETSISELFAIMRQFVPLLSENMCPLVAEMLGRGVVVNDVDSTTGMSMLHYVVRAECLATDRLTVIEALSMLLSHGADLSQRSILTDMNAFHLASFFDCSMSLEAMMNSSSKETERLLNSLCSEFNFGSPLHIAAANLSIKAAEILLKHGADVFLHDSLGRTPAACIPVHIKSCDESQNCAIMKALFKKWGNSEETKFSNAEASTSPDSSCSEMDGGINGFSGAHDRDSNLAIGDFVAVAGSRRGIIRFIGPTEFAPGIWCGVELDDNIGKNDGSINGVRYFDCEPTKGVFAPPNKLILEPSKSSAISLLRNSPRNKSLGRKPRIHSCTGAFNGETSVSSNDICLRIGMTVYLDHLKEEGKIRYIGETDFASGMWIGVSLFRPNGKNNGTVQGRRYFRCKSGHGIMVRPARVSVNGVSAAVLL